MGANVIITGASAGVGAAAARRFAELGANVAVVGRSKEKTEAVAREIGAKPYLADFARIDDVRGLADELRADFPVIDVLANNAGLIVTRPSKTVDGHETMFQVNYLAPFLLTHLLLDRLEAAPDARVIATASGAHAYSRLDLDHLGEVPAKYRVMRVYGTSKLGNILFTRELARRQKGTSVTASAFHPGFIASDFVRQSAIVHKLMGSWVGRMIAVTPDKGAEPLLRLATVSDAQSVNGVYLERDEPHDPKKAGDESVARELWDRTAALLGIGDQADR
jgi:NAD(P)-dependent dehydrogenase (short-subunit alcohol dehydrogenase family)